MKTIIKKHRQELEEHLKVQDIALFGSFSRGDLKGGVIPEACPRPDRGVLIRNLKWTGL